MSQRMTSRPRAVALMFLLVCSGAACRAGEPAAAALPALSIDPGSVTVSGVSAGGAMAVQFHTAHSKLVQGAGVLAAPPYYCAENAVANALGRCMKGGEALPVERWLEHARSLAGDGAIDPLDGMRGDRVWLYRGAADPHIDVAVADALERYYVALAGRDAVRRIEFEGAGHNFPVAAAGLAACAASEPPFLGSCGFDGATRLLEHLYGPLAPPAATPRPGGLVAFDQAPYSTAAGSRSLAGQGWLYVPAGCSGASDAACRLHVVFHGCRQGSGELGQAFVERAGYLEAAETARIVLLFPRVEATMQPMNPLGCWDWWGYEGEDYATRSGAQVAAVRAMVDTLLGKRSQGPADAPGR